MPSAPRFPVYVKLATNVNRRFEFQKRSQLFFRSHNKASAVLTLCGHNPKLSAFVIRTCDNKLATDQFERSPGPSYIFIDSFLHPIRPPSSNAVIVARDETAGFNFGSVQLQIRPHVFVKVVCIDVNPVEISIAKLVNGVARIFAVQNDFAASNLFPKTTLN